MVDPASTRLERHDFLYEACDIPEGMTISEFRRWRVAAAGAHRRTGMLKRVRAWTRAGLGT